MDEKEKDVIRKFLDQGIFNREIVVDLISSTEAQQKVILKNFIDERTAKLTEVKVNLAKQATKCDSEMADIAQIKKDW